MKSDESSARRLHLPLRTKLAFGVGAVAEGSVTIAFNTFNFLFYNNVLGLSGTLCGLAVTIALVLDAISDPVVGSLSDRLRSRLGRRHPFLYASAIPLGLCFFLIYTPPAGLGQLSLFLWFTTFAVLQRQCMAVYQVPHLALGAELSSDYHERSIVMSYNSIFAVVGGAAAYFFGFTLFDHVEGGSAVRTGYPWLAAGVALIAAGAILVSAYGTRDRIPYLRQASAEQRRFTVLELVREVSGCLRNRNYRALMAGFVLLSATIGVRETLNPYVGLFFWQLPERQLRLFGAVTAPAFLLAFLITVRLHRRFDKRTAIVGAIVVAALGATSPVALRLLGLFPGNGSPLLLPLLLLSVFVFAAGIAILMISLMSALADIADEHELTSGLRQEGVFYAARTLFGKLTSALGHVLAGGIIDLIAFPTGAKPGSVPHEVLWKLGLFEGPIASLPALIAIFFYARYRIDRARHAEIQRELAARRASAPGETAPMARLLDTDAA